jgi:hypothetical protein
MTPSTTEVETLVPMYQTYFQSIMTQGREKQASQILSSQLELVASDPQISLEEKEVMLKALAQVKINLQL